MKRLLLTFLTLTATVGSAQGQDDIVDTAINADGFDTLVAAVGAAGLVDTLRGPGPFTVFAPTDEAFAEIPEETLNALLADPEALANILLYHVVAGQVLAEDVVTLSSATTVQGSDVSISLNDGGVQVNDANILVTDIIASNGVIHVIDKVLIPPPELDDIVDTAVAAGRFGTLATALGVADLVDALKGEGPFTVFAPNDDAFAKLPADVLNGLLADPQALADILLFHVVPEALSAADVVSRNQVPTLQGSRAAIRVEDGVATIEDAQIIATDIQASNGIIHEIDSVILPPQIGGVTFEVTVTNITKSQIFSPPLVVSHRDSVSLFQLGGTASPGLKLLAEDGDNSQLLDEVFPLNEVLDLASFDGPLLPGDSATVEIQAGGAFSKISVLGMLVTTNDSFFSTELTTPRTEFIKRAVYSPQASELALVYDAGTEFNSESCDHIPGPPCGQAGASPDEAGEGFIYISPGIHGIGSLSPSDYDWRGPGALVEIRLK